jgi:hypothetical protein
MSIPLMLTIAACSQQVTTQTDAAPTDAPSAEATQDASDSPEPTEEPSESAAATIGADVDLGTLMPATVAGQQMTVRSGSGEESAGTLPFGIASEVASALSVSPAGMAWASAAAPNADVQGNHVLWAVRFPGADSVALVDRTMSALNPIALAAGIIEVSEETVGGKEVSVLPASQEAEAFYYAYAVGDVVFLFRTPDRAEAEDALAQLP